MPLYMRNWKCGVCDEPVIYDSKQHTTTCRCKVIHNALVPKHVLRTNFHKTFHIVGGLPDRPRCKGARTHE